MPRNGQSEVIRSTPDEVRVDSFYAEDYDRHLPYRLALLANRLSLHAVRALDLGLGIREMQVILVLGRYAPMTAKDIARRVYQDKTGLSHAIARLIDLGDVKSRVDAEDKRRNLLVLTAQGERKHSKISGFVKQRETLLLDALSPSEARVFDRALSSLQERVDKLLADLSRK